MTKLPQTVAEGLDLAADNPDLQTKLRRIQQIANFRHNPPRGEPEVTREQGRWQWRANELRAAISDAKHALRSDDAERLAQQLAEHQKKAVFYAEPEQARRRAWLIEVLAGASELETMLADARAELAPIEKLISDDIVPAEEKQIRRKWLIRVVTTIEHMSAEYVGLGAELMRTGPKAVLSRKAELDGIMRVVTGKLADDAVKLSVPTPADTKRRNGIVEALEYFGTRYAGMLRKIRAEVEPELATINGKLKSASWEELAEYSTLPRKKS